ncbi:MAG: DNA polymerase III subunit delta, partial [Desulfatitalea sp.]|nr:DNA polymerase III subunit delta [Desulfatitalea sp.]
FKDAKLFESEAEEGVDYLLHLMHAMEKGFAPAHFLIITVYAKVPKNRKFYKTVNTHGLIVDCHVPLGERKADKAVQESVLKGILDDVLKKTGKRIQPKLFSRLQQLTGFDPVTFRNNIEKLIDFTGQRNDITDDDITAVVRRTKSDPLFELTNAVAERDVTTALVLAEGMLGGEWHPLQVLAALANQMRKLLVAKDFAASEEGRSWKPGMGYPQFQSGVIAAIQAYDGRIAERVQAWPKPSAAPDDGGKKKGGPKGGMDLALASNPANAYPVFQTLSKSEKYGRKELIEALERLSEADMRLKSTGQNAALVLRTTIMAICAVRRAGRSPVASDRL